MVGLFLPCLTSSLGDSAVPDRLVSNTPVVDGDESLANSVQLDELTPHDTRSLCRCVRDSIAACVGKIRRTALGTCLVVYVTGAMLLSMAEISLFTNTIHVKQRALARW